MATLRRMEKYYFLIIAVVFIIFTVVFYLPNLSKRLVINENDDKNDKLTILNAIRNVNFNNNKNSYSVWPKLIDLNHYSSIWPTVNDDDVTFINKLSCLNDKQLKLKFSNLKNILDIWSSNDNDECKRVYESYMSIYDVNVKTSHVNIPNTFMSKVKSWLGNDENLFQRVHDQVRENFSNRKNQMTNFCNLKQLILVYNRFTFEENIFNLLRGKRPQKQPLVKPEI